MLELKIRLSFGKNKAGCEAQAPAVDIHSQIEAQGISAIFGPSGCGKSTVLNCIAGLEQDFEGHIRLNGQSLDEANAKTKQHLSPQERGIGYVFQSARLFPHLTAKDNILYALKRRKRVVPNLPSYAEVIEWLGVKPLLHKYPSQLSGGEQQRVAIARALLAATQLILMDEPLAALDWRSKQEIVQSLKNLSGKLKVPMIYVSHDMAELAALADHLILLEKGRVTASGEIAELLCRSDLHTAHHQEAAALLRGSVTQYDAGQGLSRLEIDGHDFYVPAIKQSYDDHEQRLRIPARDVSVSLSAPTDSSVLNVIAVTLSDVQSISEAALLLKLRLHDQYILAHVSKHSFERLGLAKGQRVFAQIKAISLLNRRNRLMLEAR